MQAKLHATTELNGDLNHNLTHVAAARLVEISGLDVLEVEDVVDGMRR